jgi:hypothetical protein
MITEKVMMPVLLASNHPIVHLSLMIAGYIIIYGDHKEQRDCKEVGVKTELEEQRSIRKM